MGLKEILARHRVPADVQGGRRPVKEALLDELEAYERRRRRLYAASLIVALLLLAVAAWALYADVRKGSNLQVGILGASGISLFGMFEVMRRQAEQWAKSHLTIALARTASEAKMHELIEMLIKAA
jgi:hypothetical protein